MTLPPLWNFSENSSVLEAPPVPEPELSRSCSKLSEQAVGFMLSGWLIGRFKFSAK